MVLYSILLCLRLQLMLLFDELRLELIGYEKPLKDLGEALGLEK